MEAFTIFEKENHLKPLFNKTEFETLHGWDFGWELLSTINIAESADEDKELSRRFSPGQKALYFFWYLDAQVTNGGFMQFYWNDYHEYLPTIKNGLQLVGDTELLNLVEQTDQTYSKAQPFFATQKAKADWKPLYEKKLFEEYDNKYYRLHDNTMALIEKYAKTNPDEFVTLK